MPHLEILIPVYNAPEHLERCVESVIAHSEPASRILLLDDGSTDPRVPELGRALQRRDERIDYVRRERNQGFVLTVNEGFELTRGDVVVLNSDTVVSRGWLEGLLRCATSDDSIGIVCPLSNNGWLLSIPIIEQENLLPPGWSIDRFAEEVARASRCEYPRLPTAVGFCMWIRRAVIDAIGGLDRVFSPGYGDEVDYSFRARARGFTIACADDTFVYHHGSASFGRSPRTDFLRQRGAILLDRFWEGYPDELLAFLASNPFAPLVTRMGLPTAR